MDVKTVTDLELAKLLAAQKDELQRVAQNVKLLQQELERRLKEAEQCPQEPG